MKADLSHLRAYLMGGGSREEGGGAWLIPLHGIRFQVIASWAMEWDHVSVSLPNRCPTYEEMDRIKRMFFEPGEVVMQLHVAEEDHISFHPFCLHLWRPHAETIPLPPNVFV